MLGPSKLLNSTIRPEYVQIVHDRIGVGFQFLIAITVDKLSQLGDVGLIWILQAGAAAFFPVLDQVETHLTGPADATFHEAEVERGITAHETAEKHATREGMIRFGEVADEIVGKIIDRRAIHPATAASVLRARDAEFYAPLPHR